MTARLLEGYLKLVDPNEEVGILGLHFHHFLVTYPCVAVIREVEFLESSLSKQEIAGAQVRRDGHAPFAIKRRHTYSDGPLVLRMQHREPLEKVILRYVAPSIWVPDRKGVLQ